MSLGIFSEIYSGMLSAFGSPWLVMVFLAIGVVAIISVLVRVNAFISIFLAAIPFIVIILYLGIAGNALALAFSVLFIGALLAISMYYIMNR